MVKTMKMKLKNVPENKLLSMRKKEIRAAREQTIFSLNKV